MFCAHCGKQIPDEAKFCANCGMAQPTPVIPEPAPTVTAEVPQPEPVVQETAAPEISEFAAPVMPAPEAPVWTPPQATPVATMEAPAKKKSKKGLVIGIVAVLIVALLAVGGYFGYGYYKDLQTYDKAVSLMEDEKYEEALKLFKGLDIKDSAKKVKELKALIAEDAAQDDDPPVDPDPNDSTPVNIDLVIKEAKLSYTLTDGDIQEYYRLLEECEQTVLNSSDEDAIRQAIDNADDQYDLLMEQYTIAMVLYYCDLTDDEASELYLTCTDIGTEADDAYMAMSQRIHNSDAFGKDIFFSDWTGDEIKMMLSYTDEVMTLQQRNSEIEVAYQDLQEDDDMYDKMVPLYIEMVQNNNRIAQIYGYENYYTYAYDLVYERDYDPSQIHVMREYAAQYIAPSMEDAMENFLASMEDMSITNSMKLSSFLMEDYEEDYVTSYLSVLPKQMREDMLGMFNGNILHMGDADGAMEGAFTTDISKDRSLCFFGPGYTNVLTVIHEVGHYYGSKHELLSDIPLDLAETQSQGNEWLFMTFIGEDMNPKLYDTLVNYKMYNDMGTILLSLMVDEFEERVYTHDDIASLTGDDLDAIMADVCQAYGGTDYIENVLTDVQEYWRMVVVEQPVYYVSYGVSAVASLNLYSMAQDDFEEAVEAYRSLNEEIDLDKGFLGNITAAGIASPFDEKVYKDLKNQLG